MKNLFYLASFAILLALPRLSYSQTCITGEGNIFNETVLIGLNATNALDAEDRIVAYASAGCIGSSSPIVSNPNQTAIALTIWQDDDLTPEIDGLLPGEAYRVYAQKPSGRLLPLVYSKTHEPDGIFIAIEAAFDTTMTAFLDSLVALRISMEATFDSLGLANSITVATLTSDLLTAQDLAIAWEANSRANRTIIDSLETAIANFPDVAEIQALRDGLAIADARVAVLEADLTAANGRFSGLLNAFRNFLNRMRNR